MAKLLKSIAVVTAYRKSDGVVHFYCSLVKSSAVLHFLIFKLYSCFRSLPLAERAIIGSVKKGQEHENRN